MSMFYENELQVKVNTCVCISSFLGRGTTVFQKREPRKKILTSHIRKIIMCVSWRRTKYTV